MNYDLTVCLLLRATPNEKDVHATPGFYANIGYYSPDKLMLYCL